MKKYTIQDLSKGKVAVTNDGTLEQLRKVVKLAFPLDSIFLTGTCKYYQKWKSYKWCGIETTDLPIQSVKDFLDQEKTYPRVMWVSDNDLKRAVKRVVFAHKREKYIAWTDGETLEEVENILDTTYWRYAWELEEQTIFPFSLQPQDAQSIIDIACNDWKEKLSNSWASSIVLKKPIEISEEKYSEMYKACTQDQKELFNKIFK
jgi:hypothetical protein